MTKVQIYRKDERTLDEGIDLLQNEINDEIKRLEQEEDARIIKIDFGFGLDGDVVSIVLMYEIND